MTLLGRVRLFMWTPREYYHGIWQLLQIQSECALAVASHG